MRPCRTQPDTIHRMCEGWKGPRSSRPLRCGLRDPEWARMPEHMACRVSSPQQLVSRALRSAHRCIAPSRLRAAFAADPLACDRHRHGLVYLEYGYEVNATSQGCDANITKRSRLPDSTRVNQITPFELCHRAACNPWPYLLRQSGMRPCAWPDLTWRPWLKWIVVADVSWQTILVQDAKPRPTNDGLILRPLLDQARDLARSAVCPPTRCLTTNAIIPLSAKTSAPPLSFPPNGVEDVVSQWGVQAQILADVLAKLYRQHACVASLCSATKRKASARAPGVYRKLRNVWRSCLASRTSSTAFVSAMLYCRVLRMSTRLSQV